MKPILSNVSLPQFGTPDNQPDLPAAVYAARLGRLITLMRQQGLDVVCIYGDREHAANISYLTGFDPRFEEALLIVPAKGDLAILVGPENMGLAARSPLPLQICLYPPFGLMGQQRHLTPVLTDLLSQLGITSDLKIGMAGWKYFGALESSTPEQWFTEPSYLVDTVRALVGPNGRVVNATALLMHSIDGLRAINEIEQLATFEFAACHTSNGIIRVLKGLRPGMREFEAAALLSPIGLPLSCHPMLSSGPRAALGLCSPGNRVIEHGDALTVGYGVWGALNCRAGWVIADVGGLPPAASDYLDKLVVPYFGAVAEWYRTVGIGVPGDDLDRVVRTRLGDPFFGVGLNPGHLIHIDEWMNTPIYKGSTEPLKSGHAIQVDIIPATGSPYFTTNIEDGIALLDQRGRDEFAQTYPAAWNRIQARRAFMADVIGIELKPEVLPFSNMPAWLPPFLLAPDQAMVMVP